MQEVRLVGVSGIPAAGKSTLLARLAGGVLQDMAGKDTAVVFAQEDVDGWTRAGWLDAFYSDPSRYAAAFQFMAFDSHVRAVEDAIACGKQTGCSRVLVLTERTMYDQSLFWRLQVESKHATADAFYDAAYKALWTRWKQLIPEPSHVWYVVPPSLDAVMERVASRGRDAEGGLTRSYQERLLRGHNALYTQPHAMVPGGPDHGIPCAHVDGAGAWKSDPEALQQLAAQMWGAMKALY